MATDRRFGVTGDYAIKMPVKALAAANLTLYGAKTIDSVRRHDRRPGARYRADQRRG